MVYGLLYFYETFWTLLDHGSTISFLLYCKKTSSMNQGNLTKTKKQNLNH